MKLVKRYTFSFCVTLIAWMIMNAIINHLTYGEFAFDKWYFVPPVIVTLMAWVGNLMKLWLKNEESVSIMFMWTFISCSIAALILMAVTYYTIIDNMYEFKTMFGAFTISVIIVSIFNAIDKWKEGKKK